MKDMSTRLTEKKVARERAFEMKMKVEKEAWETILAKVHHQFIVYNVNVQVVWCMYSVQCTVYSANKIQFEFMFINCLNFSHFKFPFYSLLSPPKKRSKEEIEIIIPPPPARKPSKEGGGHVPYAVLGLKYNFTGRIVSVDKRGRAFKAGVRFK